MAKPEKVHNNESIVTALSKTTYTGLSTEARQVITDTIQACAFLGQYKIPEKDVYLVVRKCESLSKAIVENCINIDRVSNNKKQIHGSSVEKYKRACTLVSEAFRAFIDQGGQVDRLKQLIPTKPFSEAVIEESTAMMLNGASAEDMVKYFQSKR